MSAAKPLTSPLAQATTFTAAGLGLGAVFVGLALAASHHVVDAAYPEPVRPTLAIGPAGDAVSLAGAVSPAYTSYSEPCGAPSRTSASMARTSCSSTSKSGAASAAWSAAKRASVASRIATACSGSVA